MEKKLLISLNVLFSLTLVSLILVGILLLGSVTFGSAPAPLTSQPPPASDLEVRVKSLEAKQEALERDLVFRLDQKLFYYSGIALVISAVAAFFGWKTYKDLDEKIRKKVDETLEQQLYQLDPTNLKIWLVSYDKPVRFRGEREGETLESNVSSEMQRVRQRIELTGLKNIRELDEPDRKCYRGVTILPIFDKEMEDEFKTYLENNHVKLDPQKAAFILYTRDYRVSQKKTLDQYENLVTANMPPTAASMILTVGRGLTNEKPKKEKEGA